MKYLKMFEEYKNLNPNFYKWFDESKVVDENNHPLIAYHGTGEYYKSTIDKIFDCSKGCWFTESLKVAKVFTHNKLNPKILKVYLKIENPKIYETWFDYMNDVKEWKSEIINIKNKILLNYDGIIIEKSNTDIDVIRKDFIMFYPNYIKNIKNDGSWDIDDSNIYS
jgi:hypothetical protein